jgi:hypothetical protein
MPNAISSGGDQRPFSLAHSPELDRTFVGMDHGLLATFSLGPGVRGELVPRLDLIDDPHPVNGPVQALLPFRLGPWKGFFYGGVTGGFGQWVDGAPGFFCGALGYTLPFGFNVVQLAPIGQDLVVAGTGFPGDPTEHVVVLHRTNPF